MQANNLLIMHIFKKKTHTLVYRFSEHTIKTLNSISILERTIFFLLY